MSTNLGCNFENSSRLCVDRLVLGNGGGGRDGWVLEVGVGRGPGWEPAVGSAETC